MPRRANREMLTPSPRASAIPRGRPVPEWGEGTVTLRYDDGSGRVVQARPRFMNAEERRNFPALVEQISREHAEDLQALADI